MGNKKIKFAFFTIPEYKKEEKWLRKNHNKGWKFVKVYLPGIYFFEKCEPEDVKYQLDYNQEGISNKPSYIKMFSDCNWEYITDFMGYSYFRKSVNEMNFEDEGIFSDDESKLEMTKRVFRGRMVPLIILFFGLIIPQLFLQSSIGDTVVFYLYLALFALYSTMFLWFGIQYWSLKRKMH